MRCTIALSGLVLAMLLAVGCTNEKPGTDPSGRATSDPMNYKPGFEDQDISGGGFTDFNKKAFNRDVDNVFNP